MKIFDYANRFYVLEPFWCPSIYNAQAFCAVPGDKGNIFHKQECFSIFNNKTYPLLYLREAYKKGRVRLVFK